MVQDLFNYGRVNRKGNTIDGMMNFDFGASLDLGLTYPGAAPNCNAKSATTFSSLTSGRELHLPVPDLNMDFDLHLGLKNTGKEVKSSSLNFVEPDNTNYKVDLALSLSIGATESDVTSINFASSSVQTRSDIHGMSSMVQLVDEGSISSKWRGSLLHPSPLVAPVENQAPIANPSSNEGRKTSVKTCQYPGCTKGARGASGHCISHGGGRRCQRIGCQKGAEGRTVFCKAHGGGRRCEYLGCTKSAEGRTDFCISHGGGRRCNHHEGCSRAARGRSGFCIRHGGGKRCKVEDCTRSAEGLSGRCIAHGGGRRCQYPECDKGAQGSTKYCKAHGGGKRCTFLGCSKGAEGSTAFCKGHGGGKRCTFEGGCSKSVHGGTLFCVAHGGGKRCAVTDCTRSARGKTNFCVRHGGGKRCQNVGCPKSAQGSTDYCKAHGGGRRCFWGQPGSPFGANSAPCDKFARGKLGLCAAHSADVQDKCVHGDNTVSHLLQNPKGKEIAIAAENVSFIGSYNAIGEGTSSGITAFTFGANEYMMSMNIPPNPEGRVHGGGLMAMLRENLVSFEFDPAAGTQQPVARTWI